MRKFLEKIKKEINLTKVLLRSRSASNGMTYIELIVVLSIFAVMSGVAIFNYDDFQAKVDVKNLASDIGLKILGAQRASLSGLVPPGAEIPQTWRPSYGAYFNITQDNKSFVYFSDINNNKFCDGLDCGDEQLEKIIIAKGGVISGLAVFYPGDETPYELSDLTATFTRPNSAADISSSTVLNPPIDYVQITITSPQGPTALIKLYASGRIDIK